MLPANVSAAVFSIFTVVPAPLIWKLPVPIAVISTKMKQPATLALVNGAWLIESSVPAVIKKLPSAIKIWLPIEPGGSPEAGTDVGVPVLLFSMWPPLKVRSPPKILIPLPTLWSPAPV